MISRLLEENNIQVIDKTINWEKALEIASDPLIKSRTITKKYVENMIESVKKNGPYMVLNDYFALMHVRPGDGVEKLGMSLLVLKNSVDLGGKPVKIFLVLAALDNKSHLDSLKSIMSVFMDINSYQTILEGNKEKILTLFKNVEE